MATDRRQPAQDRLRDACLIGHIDPAQARRVAAIVDGPREAADVEARPPGRSHFPTWSTYFPHS
jgi:hypothetical protein